MNRAKIINALNNHLTIQDVEKDFLKLQHYAASNTEANTFVGNKTVNFFSLGERLNTIGNKNINFYDFVSNFDSYKDKAYIKNIIEFYSSRQYDKVKMMKCIFNLYFGSIAIFKPSLAVDIYKQFKPKYILDFCSGWGGRMVAACSLNIQKYIGIESNKNLINPYEEMQLFLDEHSTTETLMIFEDCLKVDYKNINYDFVLTSPPYYNLEIYNGMERKTKYQWNEEFYKPIFKKTFECLGIGGVYCLNVNKEIYESCCVAVLGECQMKIPMSKMKRTRSENYKEFIYVWKK